MSDLIYQLMVGVGAGVVGASITLMLVRWLWPEEPRIVYRDIPTCCVPPDALKRLFFQMTANGQLTAVVHRPLDRRGLVGNARYAVEFKGMEAFLRLVAVATGWTA